MKLFGKNMDYLSPRQFNQHWLENETQEWDARAMIAHWPKGINKKSNGTITEAMGHVMDIMATCIDLGKAKYPAVYKGNKIIPLEGKSLVPILKKGKRKGHDELCFEHFNEKALITSDFVCTGAIGSIVII